MNIFNITTVTLFNDNLILFDDLHEKVIVVISVILAILQARAKKSHYELVHIIKV